MRWNDGPIQTHCREDVVCIGVYILGTLLLSCAFWSVGEIALLLDGRAREIDCPDEGRVAQEEAIVMEPNDVIITLICVLLKRNTVSRGRLPSMRLERSNSAR